MLSVIDRRRLGSSSLNTRYVIALLFSAYILLFMGTAKCDADNSLDKMLTQAITAYTEQRYDDATNILSIAAKKFPNDSSVFYWLSLTHAAKGKLNLAINAITRAHELVPDDPTINEFYHDLVKINVDLSTTTTPKNRQRQAISQTVSTDSIIESPINPQKTSRPTNLITSPNWPYLKHRGFVALVQEQHRWGVHLLAGVLFIAVPIAIFRFCVWGLGLPFYQLGNLATILIVTITCTACYAIAWGTQPSWRMVACAIVSLFHIKYSWSHLMRSVP